ncbi:hypothetical protein AB0I91_01750 [Actinosynnema sp. NPDC049800]
MVDPGRRAGRIALADWQVRAGRWRKAEPAGHELSGKDFWPR